MYLQCVLTKCTNMWQKKSSNAMKTFYQYFWHTATILLLTKRSGALLFIIVLNTIFSRFLLIITTQNHTLTVKRELPKAHND